MKETIEICIGTEPKTSIPCKVLMFSIQANTQSLVNFHLMEGVSWEVRSQVKHGEGTGFSLKRWDIPRYFAYQGYAIYLDADQLVFGDIQGLWDYKNQLDNHCVACTYQPDKWFDEPNPNTSVMLMNNQKCRTDPGWLDGEFLRNYLIADTDRKRYVKIMHALHLVHPPLKISNQWNSLNVKYADTKLLHYTKEPEQPWYKPGHRYAEIWGKYLIQCIAAGFITIQEIEKAVSVYKPHTNKVRGQGLHPYWLERVKNDIISRNT